MTAPVAPLWVRLVQVPKAGTAPEDCQDAAGVDAARGRFALADGATESWHSALWARLLVESFLARDEPIPPLPDWLLEPRRTWIEQTDREVPHEPGQIEWFLEERYRLGAYSTFLGLALTRDVESGSLAWSAVALGDTCLFLVRDERLLALFPIDQASRFDSVPWLVGSRGGDEIFRQHADFLAGGLLPGDQLFLMTDALALWFLQRHELEKKPWEALRLVVQVEHPLEAFRLWMDGMRQRHLIRDDDVTLLMIRVE